MTTDIKQKMKIICITPTRGDRPQFIKNCKRQIKEQTKKADLHIIVDREPESNKVDIIPRIKDALDVCRFMNPDIICIIEDDDYYPPHYLELVEQQFKKGADIVGDPITHYYHLHQEGARKFIHPNRASLFTTSFTPQLINLFPWPEDHTPNLDIYLWRWAANMSNRTDKLKVNMNLVKLDAIGIKHGLGKCAGNGHKMNLTNKIPLKEVIQDPKSLKFFKSISHAQGSN